MIEMNIKKYLETVLPTYCVCTKLLKKLYIFKKPYLGSPNATSIRN